MRRNTPTEPTLTEAIREMCDDGVIRTHSESCWQWHLPCAAMYAADVIDQIEELTNEFAGANMRIRVMALLERVGKRFGE